MSFVLISAVLNENVLTSLNLLASKLQLKSEDKSAFTEKSQLIWALTSTKSNFWFNVNVSVANYLFNFPYILKLNLNLFALILLIFSFIWNITIFIKSS